MNNYFDQQNLFIDTFEKGIKNYLKKTEGLKYIIIIRLIKNNKEIQKVN